MNGQNLIKILEEQIDQLRIEVPSTPLKEDAPGFFDRKGFFVRTRARQRIEHICDGTDTTPERDLLSS